MSSQRYNAKNIYIINPSKNSKRHKNGRIVAKPKAIHVYVFSFIAAIMSHQELYSSSKGGPQAAFQSFKIDGSYNLNNPSEKYTPFPKCSTSLASSFSKSWPLIPLRKVANRATDLLLASKICWEHRKSSRLSSSGDLAPARLSAVYIQVQGSLWAQTPKPFRAVLMVFRLWLFVFYCYEKDLHSEKLCLSMLNEKKCPRKHIKVTTKKIVLQMENS